MIDCEAPAPPTETASAHAHAVLAGQGRALQALVAGRPLTDVFEALIATVEATTRSSAIAAILLLDDDGRRLRHGAAPSLPDSYNRAIDGFQIGPEIGTCAAAAARNETVVTVDIESDPGWAAFKALPLELGLVAAWSMPIRNPHGKVLGTFGTYFRERRAPTAMERSLVTVLATTAALAIEQRAMQETLRRNSSFLEGVVRSSSDCLKVLDLDGRLQWMSEAGQCAMDVTDFSAIKGAQWIQNWTDPAERAQAAEACAAALRGEVGRFSGYCPTLSGAPKWWDVVITGIRPNGEAIQSLLAVSRDITGQKKSEQALRHAEDRLRGALEETEQRVERRTKELAEANDRLRREIEAGEKTEQERRKLLMQMGGAEEEERRRISRELHDQVGQQLTALGLGLNALRPQLRDAGVAQWQELRSQVTAIEKEIHDLALDLRPTALDDLGLAAALGHAIDRWSAQSAVGVEFHCASLGHARFPSRLETALYRIVVEALNNVARHARARRIGVVLERRDERLIAIVADDGVGFDRAAVRGERLGLRGMRERAAKCGGTLQVESEPGQGTTVCADLPVRLADSDS